MVKFAAFFSTLCLVCLLTAMGVFFGLYGSHRFGASTDSPAIVTQVRRLNELATVKYSIEKVVGMKEEKSPLGEESILLLVRGKVVAGVDLALLAPNDVTVSKRDIVRIRLPIPSIQETYLEEKHTKVWDRSITWWTPWVTPDPDLEHKARMQALDDIKAEAMEMGIIAEAQRNAEVDVRSLLYALGIKQLVFTHAD